MGLAPEATEIAITQDVERFVRDAHANADPQDLATVALAEALGRATVAGGVDSLRQWRVLHDLGLDAGQRYGPSLPLTESGLRAWVHRCGGHVESVRPAPDVLR